MLWLYKHNFCRNAGEKNFPLAFFQAAFWDWAVCSRYRFPLLGPLALIPTSTLTVQAKTFSCVIPVAWSSSVTSLWLHSVLHLFFLCRSFLCSCCPHYPSQSHLSSVRVLFYLVRFVGIHGWHTVNIHCPGKLPLCSEGHENGWY